MPHIFRRVSIQITDQLYLMQMSTGYKGERASKALVLMGASVFRYISTALQHV